MVRRMHLSLNPSDTPSAAQVPVDLEVHVPEGDAPSSGFPAILYCPGLRGNPQNLNRCITEYFTNQGFVTGAIRYKEIQPNTPEHAWVRPLDRVHEAVQSVDIMSARDDVDANRVGIYGLSYGGPIAICAASLATNVRAVVSAAGPGNGWRMMRSMRTRAEWSIFIARLEEDRRRQEEGEPPTKVSLLELLPFSDSYQKKLLKFQDELVLSPDDDVDPKYFLETAFYMLNFHPEQAAALLHNIPLLQICGDQDECATHAQIEEISKFASCENKIHWMPGGTDHLDLHVNPGRNKQLALASDWFATHLH